MDTRIALITGATGGIGKAAALALARLGYTVVIHGRNKEKTMQVCAELKAASGNDKIDMLVADLFLLNDVKRMATAFTKRYTRLDVLVNNAGGLMSKERELTAEGFEKTIALNVLAPFLLTELLLGLLKQSPDGRIVNVASNSHQLNARPDFSDLPLANAYNPLAAYGNAKLFLIWNTGHLSECLKHEGFGNVTANTLHPGAVATNFGLGSNLGPVLNLVAKWMRPFFKTAEQGADTLVYLASAPEVKGQSGQYFVNRKPARVSAKYDNAANRKRVWEYCAGATKGFLVTP